MARLALRSLGARKLRTFLTSLAIVLGVMMVAGTYILTDTIDRSFEQIFTESGEGIDAVVSAREVVETDDGSLPPFEESILAEVKRTEGVALASGGIADPQVSIIGADGEPRGGNGAPSFGFSASSKKGAEQFDPLTYVEGGRPDAGGEVVIDKASADAEGFELGDMVEIAGKEQSREYELAGIATLGDVDSFGGATLALLTLPEAQRITGKEDQLDEIAIAAEEGTSPERLAAALNETLPRSVEARTGDENVQEQRDDVGEFVGFLNTALLIFAGVALFVAAFLIFNTFSITVAQRTREFAMLRTLGANRRQIISAVVLEAFAIGLLASLLGLAAGVGFAPAVGALFESLGIDLPTQGMVIQTRTVIVSLVLGTGIAVLAALIPAVRATRIPPVQGLREGVVLETSKQRGRRSAAAVVLTGLGAASMLLGLFGVLDPGGLWLGVGAFAMFIGVALLSPRLVAPMASLVGRPLERLRGVPGKIARENAIRNPGRTAVTAAALMIGLALVSFVAVFAAGLRGSIDNAIEQTLVSDLIIANNDGFSDIPARTADAVAEIDGVEVASPIRYTQNEVDGADGGGYLTLVDPQTVEGVLTLDWEEGSQDVLAGLGADDAAVDEKWAEENGFEVGEAFTATTGSGEEIDYTVRGTFKDNTDFMGDYAASDVNAEAYGEGTNATNVLVNVGGDADAEAVRAEIEDTLEAGFPTVETQNQQELKDTIGEELNTLLGAVYALLLLAVIVSLFGIVNTLALSIHERTRELGLLRAVGTSRRQVRRIVRYEAVITALIGAVLGTILGVVFAVIVSRPLADEGFILSIPVGTLIGLLVLALVAGVVAAIGPARRASRLDVLEALAYE
jgi:putative ABC transport system permease protein